MTQVFTGAPTIITHPTSRRAVAGTNATLTCEGTGKGLIKYQWEASNIKGEKWMNISNTTNAKLDLTDLRQSQQYRCIVSNEAGGVRSNPAVITVLSKQVQTVGIGILIGRFIF